MTNTEDTITVAEWNRLHPAQDVGCAVAGVARAEVGVEGAGTCLVPVRVVAR